MKLNINDTMLIEDVTAEGLEGELRALNPDQFLILSKSKNDFIQVYFTNNMQFVVEYQVNGELFCAHDERISYESVKEAFASYFTGSENWLKIYNWQSMNSEDLLLV